MRGAFAFAVSRGDAPLRCRRRAAPVVPHLGRLARLRGYVLMALSRNRASCAWRDYGGGEQPDPGTPPYSRQPLLIGGTRIRAPNESGNTKSIYTKPRGTNGLAPPPSAGRVYHARSDITSHARLASPPGREKPGHKARKAYRHGTLRPPYITGRPMQAGIGERKPYFGASTMTI